MTVFILPTKGSTAYRGKYPNRARHIGGSTRRATGRHVELNCGMRLWSADDKTPEYSCGGLNDDYTTVLARAVEMTAEQYQELLKAAERQREVIGYIGHERRARKEAQVRAIVEAIKPIAPKSDEQVQREAAAERLALAESYVSQADAFAKAAKLPGAAEPGIDIEASVSFHVLNANEHLECAQDETGVFDREATENAIAWAAILTREAIERSETVSKPAPIRIGKREELDSGLIDPVGELRGTGLIVAAPQVIDCTPTWSGILPALLAALTCGTNEGPHIARQELQRMAALADERNVLANRMAAAVSHLAQFYGEDESWPEALSALRVADSVS